MSGGGDATGSRFVLEGFDKAHARIEANERVLDARWQALDYRLGLIDAALERLERRIWLAVYGVAGFVLAEAASAVLRAALR